MNSEENNNYLQILDLLTILAISVISLNAILIQIYTHELPCPLCLLQRAGLIAIIIPYISNVTIKRSRFNYLLAIFASFLTMLPSTRQIFLHIAPGTGYYGNPIFGLHLYTWVFIICLVMIFWNAFLMSMCRNYYDLIKTSKIAKVILFIFTLTILLNVISTFLECGLTQCPADPVKYELLH